MNESMYKVYQLSTGLDSKRKNKKDAPTPFTIRSKYTGFGGHKRKNSNTESGLTGLIVCHVSTWTSFRQG